jgi:chromosome segregation ATPase
MQEDMENLGDLSSHIASLMKSREEYRTLHDNLLLVNRLNEEREERDGRRIKDMQLEMESLRRQLEDARNVIVTQQQMRGSFERDVHSLSRAASSLEDREKEMNNRAQELRTQHSALQEENDKHRQLNQQLQTDLDSFRRENETLRAELASMDEDRSTTAGRIILLENNKAALLTQLGGLKIANRKEVSLRDSLFRRLGESDEQLKHKTQESERYRVLFEKEHGEVERYRLALEQTARQLNESEKELSEFHDILLEEVGTEEMMDDNARTPNPISAIKLSRSSGMGPRSAGTDAPTTMASPHSFLGSTALTEDFGYGK